MAEEETLWVVNVGATEERGEQLEISLLQQRMAGGGMVVLAFSTQERATEYMQVLKNDADAHMEMLEASRDLERASAVTQGNYLGMRMAVSSITRSAAKLGSSAVLVDPNLQAERRAIRAPRKGEHQPLVEHVVQEFEFLGGDPPWATLYMRCGTVGGPGPEGWRQLYVRVTPVDARVGTYNLVCPYCRGTLPYDPRMLRVPPPR